MSAEVFATVFPFWIKAFGFTLAVEIPLFVLIGRLGAATKMPVWRLLVAGAAGTMITHPLLWFVWSQVVSDYTAYIASGELLIAIVESFTFWLIARQITLGRAVAASFIANSASYGGGLLLSAITGQ